MNRILKITIALMLVLIPEMGILIVIMNAPINFNEYVYIAASVLYSRYRLYKDFGFLQMPVLPMIYGTFFKLSGTSHYLFFGRLFNLLFLNISVLFVYLLAFRYTKNFIASLSLALLLVCNDMIISVMSESSNYVMPMAFSLAGYYLFIVGSFNSRDRRSVMLLSGVLSSLAAGAKLFYAFLVPVFLIVSLIYPRSIKIRERLSKKTLPLLLGLVIGSAPSFYYLISSYHSFIFYNLDYRFLYARLAKSANYSLVMSWPEKLNLARSLLSPITISDAGALALITAIFFAIKLAGGGYLRFRKLKMFPGEFLLIIMILSVSIVTIFLPSTMWRQYFAMPVPFVIILLACCLEGKVNINRSWPGITVSIIIFLAFSANIPDYLQMCPRSRWLRNWEVTRVHNDALKIRDSIKHIDRKPKIATLYTIYPLEADMEIYKEFACGVFLYQVGDYIPEKDRKYLVYASPGNLFSLLAKDPPDAILVGFNYNDEPFARFANANGYRQITLGPGAETIYVPGNNSQ